MRHTVLTQKNRSPFASIPHHPSPLEASLPQSPRQIRPKSFSTHSRQIPSYFTRLIAVTKPLIVTTKQRGTPVSNSVFFIQSMSAANANINFASVPGTVQGFRCLKHVSKQLIRPFHVRPCDPGKLGRSLVDDLAELHREKQFLMVL